METIGGDLTPFYEDLEALGFFTYPESKSNYYNTPRSVASILNLQYLEGDETLLTDKALEHKSQNNIVFKKLSDLYQIHVFTSSSLIDSIYTRQFIENDYKQGNNYLLFYTLFCHTPIKHIFENCSAQHFTDYCCNSIMSTLQELANCKTKYSSTNHLFYAHFLCPHEPCVFGSKQSNNLAFKGFASVMDPLYVIDKETHNALRDNVYGIDQCVLIYLKEIIKQYETESIKPIIILHSDHSILNLIIRLPQSPLFTADNIYGNLLAIYMPDEWKVDFWEQPTSHLLSVFKTYASMEFDLWATVRHFLLVLLVLLLVPALNLSGMISSRMEGRLAEMGVRKSFGAGRKILLSQVMWENLLLTALGGALGLLLAWLALYVGREWIFTVFDSWPNMVPEGVEVRVSGEMLFAPLVFLAALALCVVLNLLSALIPAWYSLRKPIVNSLNEKR